LRASIQNGSIADLDALANRLAKGDVI